MRRTAPKFNTHWIPAVFATLVVVVMFGGWAISTEGPARFGAVVVLTALVPLALFAGALAAQGPLDRRASELNKLIEEEQVARRSHDEIYSRFINELRAPLTAVYGLSRHLDDSGISNTAEAEELIGIISHDATEVVRKVENIATAAQIESGVYRPVPSAVDLARHVQRMVDAIGRSRIEITVDAKPTIVWCDPAAARQILINIVHIASDAGATTLRFDIDERNGLGIVSATDDRIHHEAREQPTEDLLGTAAALSSRIVPILVEFQGATMNTFRSLGWTTTVIQFPAATPAQRSEDLRALHGASVAAPTDSSTLSESSRMPLPNAVPRQSRRVVTGRSQRPLGN